MQKQIDRNTISGCNLTFATIILQPYVYHVTGTQRQSHLQEK